MNAICGTETSVNNYEYSLATLQKSQGFLFEVVNYSSSNRCRAVNPSRGTVACYLLRPFCGVPSGLSL